jgi:L-lysine 6-transaminase
MMKITRKNSPQNDLNQINKHMLFEPPYLMVDFEKSHGSYLHDSLTGRDYLDFYTFFASLPIGFNHPKMMNSEFLQAIQRTGLCKPANSDVLSAEMAKFAETFHKIAAPEGFDHLFFISGGALAVENALKAAFDWKVRKNLEQRSNNLGSKIIHFFKAFHGRTGYTLSLTNTFDPNKTKYFPKFDWPRITAPIMQFPQNEENRLHVMDLELKALAEIEQAFKDNPNDIAAIIIERIQGEGGDNHFRPEFFRRLRQVADENEAILIYDEVQTGMGLTGKMWCAEHFDAMPDIICFGKKAQVGGIMSNNRLQEVDSVFKVAGRINSTFGGNLVDMVRATRYLQIIEEDNLVANSAKVGQYMLEQLVKISDRYETLSNVRGRGLMIAFDLPGTKERNTFRDALYEAGCMVLACGEKSIRLRPALNLSVENADTGLAFIEDGLKKIQDR